MVDTRLSGRNLHCMKAFNTSFPMRLPDLVPSRFWTGKHLFTNHKIVLKASCSYLSRHRSRMHNMQDGQIRETCHIEFRTIPGRGCDSRAHQVYKAKGDGVTVRPSLFRNAYKLSLIYINSAQGRQSYMQTVVSCVFFRAMRCK